MTGQLLDYSIQTNTGVISGDDGNRYSFTGEDWQEPSLPQPGMRVDFEPDGNHAAGIYSEARIAGAAYGNMAHAGAAPGVKSKTTAGLLAIFLGGVGAHKFYLGYTGIGLLHIAFWWVALFASCGACVAAFFTFGVSLALILIIWLIYWSIPIVEGIIYLTKSDDEFHQTYVVNTRVFF